jgi:hypothetical protein
MADPTVVLVHGAFADASGFRGLYDELLGEDMTVLAPPNPLRGLSGGDGEYIKAVVGEIDGPGRRGFARCHDLPPQGSSGDRHDRSPHLRRAAGLI